MKIEEDLISSKFNLNDDFYETNAFNFEFENDQLYARIKFAEDTKWIKNIKRKAYLLTNVKSYFELINLDEDFMIKELDNSSANYGLIHHLALQCKGQSLAIKNDVFCFTEDVYYHMGGLGELSFFKSEQHSIESIFKNSSINWNNNKLKFIFNYKDNNVVFMTLTYLFIFEIEDFKIKDEIDKSIVYRFNDQIIKLRNCFFLKCESSTESSTESLNESSTNESSTKEALTTELSSTTIRLLETTKNTTTSSFLKTDGFLNLICAINN